MQPPTFPLATIIEIEQQNDIHGALSEARKMLSSLRAAKKVRRELLEELLLIMARLASKIDNEECLRYCDEVYSAPSRSPKDRNRAVRALLTKGIFFSRHGHIKSAEDLFEKADTILRSKEVSGKDVLYGVLSHNVGVLYLRVPTLENILRSQEYHNKAITISRITQNTALLASALLNSTGVAIELGALAEATQKLDEAMSLVRAEENKTTLCKILCTKARLVHEQGRYEEAIKLLYESLQLAEQCAPQQLPFIITNIQMVCVAIQAYHNALLLGKALITMMEYNREIHDAAMLFYCYTFSINSALAMNKTADVATMLAMMKTSLPDDESGEMLNTYRYLQARRALLCNESEPIEEFLAATEGQHLIAEHKNKNYIIAKEILLRADILARYAPQYSYEEVLRLTDIAVEIYTTAGVMEQLWMLEQLLAIYTFIGEQERLLRYKEEHAALIEKLYKDNNTEVIYSIVRSIEEQISFIKEQRLIMTIERIRREYGTSEMERRRLQLQNEEIKRSLDSKEQSIRLLQAHLSARGIKDQAVLSILERAGTGGPEKKTYLAPHTSIPECPAPLRTFLLQHNKTLTPKEMSFCHITLQGYDIYEIGKFFGISAAGVRKMRYRLARKLCVPRKMLFQQFLLQLTENM